ncbi:MAG: YihY/virulence factor BrkB family protein [Oscillospiraceae bacterium]|nr:YihY/virulence factor BrkB family protein [Oscillospiraceae bacterium]
MKDFPRGGVVGKLYSLICYFTKLRVPVYAANAGYFIVLSVFPMLLLFVGFLRYTGLSVDSLTQLLHGVVPEALIPSAKRLILNTYQSTSGTVVSISAVTALWSGSRGIYGLLTGLNAIYNVSEDRGYLYTRTVSVLYTFVFLLVLLLTLVVNVFGTTLLQMLPVGTGTLWEVLSGVVDLRFFVLLFVQTAVFTAMYMVLPNRHNKLMDSLPGALLTSVGWLVFSDLYSLYVENFSSYANIYGSVYAVALSMLWLYCCISIVFYGGALNIYLTKNRPQA